MTDIAWLGLGQMGAPMAARFLAAGFGLRVWNRTAAKAAPLCERGARLASTPAEAARGAAAVFTMLGTPAALLEVVSGPQGLAAGLEPDSLFIDMSTVGPPAIHAVATSLPAGVHFLDAPVLGSVPQAVDGTLRIFVGGAPAALERGRHLLEVLGTPSYVGPLGAGAALKLVVNSTLGALMTALGEALALADGLGLELGPTLDVLAESPIGAPVRGKRQHLESGSYPPRFKLGLAAKDLQLVSAAAHATGRDLPLVEAARAWFEAAAAAGLEPLDYSAVVAHIRGQPARP